MEYEEA